MRAAILILTLIFAATAFAIPGVPHQFYGDVRINGATASDGTTVSAVVNGETTTAGTSGGYFRLLVEDRNSVLEGSTVSFYVNGISAGSAVFSNGMSTRMDLSVSTPSTGNSGGSSGGGGGGSSSSSPAATTTTVAQAPPEHLEGICPENWACSNWSECMRGEKTRACVDKNSCGTSYDKPDETQFCESDAMLSGNPVTGAAAVATGTAIPYALPIIIGVMAFFGLLAIGGFNRLKAKMSIILILLVAGVGTLSAAYAYQNVGIFFVNGNGIGCHTPDEGNLQWIAD